MNTFATKSSSCCVSGTGNRRITREERITLRNISVGKKSLSQRVTKVFHNINNAVSAFVSFMLSPIKKATPANNMCKFYGHVIQGPWQGYLPKCRDCGVEIQSADQLRKAMPRS